MVSTYACVNKGLWILISFDVISFLFCTSWKQMTLKPQVIHDIVFHLLKKKVKEMENLKIKILRFPHLRNEQTDSRWSVLHASLIFVFVHLSFSKLGYLFTRCVCNRLEVKFCSPVMALRVEITHNQNPQTVNKNIQILQHQQHDNPNKLSR